MVGGRAGATSSRSGDPEGASTADDRAQRSSPMSSHRRQNASHRWLLVEPRWSERGGSNRPSVEVAGGGTRLTGGGTMRIEPVTTESDHDGADLGETPGLLSGKLAPTLGAHPILPRPRLLASLTQA